MSIFTKTFKLISIEFPDIEEFKTNETSLEIDKYPEATVRVNNTKTHKEIFALKFMVDDNTLEPVKKFDIKFDKINVTSGTFIPNIYMKIKGNM